MEKEGGDNQSRLFGLTDVDSGRRDMSFANQLVIKKINFEVMIINMIFLFIRNFV